MTQDLEIREIPLDKIDPAGKSVNVRYEAEEDTTEIDSLATSIKQLGLINPITLRRKGNRYEVIAGNRRLRAAKMAGLQSVTAHVISGKASAMIYEINDIQGRRIAFAENAIRKDFSAVDRGKNLAQIYRDILIDPGVAIQLVKHVYNDKLRNDEQMSKRNTSSAHKEFGHPENEYHSKELGKMITPKFMEAYNSVSLDGNTQFQFLQLVVHIDPEAAEIASETKLPFNKAILLTNSQLRKHPSIQRTLAYEISKPNSKGRAKSIQESRDLVNQTIHDLNTGALTKGRHGYDMNYYDRENIKKKPETETDFVITAHELNQEMMKIIGKLIDRRLTKGEIMYTDEIVKPKIEELKKNLKTLREKDRIWIANSASHLMMICKAIVEAAQ